MDWADETLRVQRQVQRIPRKGFVLVEPKTRAGRRTIQLADATLILLRQHRERQDAEKILAGSAWEEGSLIFPSIIGTPLDHRNLYRIFARLVKAAGVPKIRFHDLRHTAASILLNRGVPVIVVSRMLGHARPSITLDIYGHLIHEM